PLSRMSVRESRQLQQVEVTICYTSPPGDHRDMAPTAKRALGYSREKPVIDAFTDSRQGLHPPNNPRPA
ncbi:MAG: hypothetical protein MUP21_02210, partial [Dehalococcoidia bacterium]|nr:hypothetical protein [Dehalococcoidia bacterium]